MGHVGGTTHEYLREAAVIGVVHVVRIALKEGHAVDAGA
jgi:hypothetical protein